MDVAGSPGVAQGCLLRKARDTGLDENLVEWTGSFTRGIKVIMSVDGQYGEATSAITGLPQGSLILPVLFAIYIVEIHRAVMDRVERCRGTSFVDDVT